MSRSVSVDVVLGVLCPTGTWLVATMQQLGAQVKTGKHRPEGGERATKGGAVGVTVCVCVC